MLEGVTKVQTASTNTFSADPKHMFSVSAASPGRANSLLQKYFLQTRVPSRGSGSQELARGACECSHTLLTALTGVLACLAGHWQ